MQLFNNILRGINKSSIKNKNLVNFTTVFFSSFLLVCQVLGLLNFLNPIKAEAAGVGPFWSWNGSGAPTKIAGTDNLDTVAIGGLTFFPNSDYYIGLQGNQVYAWGRNDQGQLGNGTNTDILSPTLITGLNNVSKVVTGQSTTFAITTSGNLLNWGQVVTSSPTTVSGISNVVDVFPGGAGAIAVTSGGLVYDVFAGNATNIGSLSNIKKVARTYTGSYYALDNNGEVWSWGENAFGQIGNGSTTNNPTPTKLPGLTGIKEISAGSEHVLALDSNNEVWSWGRSWEGQTGSGSIPPSQTTPIKVPGLPPIKTILGATNSSKAVSFDEVVWEWGSAKTGGQSPIPGTIPNPADPSKPMLAENGTVATNGRTTISKRALVFEPILTVAKTSSATEVNQGGTLTFTINYSNTGNAAATNVVITDTLLSQFSFASCTNSCVNSGQDVTWNIANVPATTSGSVSVTVNVGITAPVGSTSNTAIIDSDQTTPTTGSVQVGINPLPSGLFISKSANSSVVQRNDGIIYTLTYNNTRNTAVNNVVITDVLDSRLIIFNYDSACSQSGQTVSCNIASVAANTSGSLDIEVSVDSNAAGGPLANTALIISDETITEPRSGSSIITVNVPQNNLPPIEIEKTVNTTTANVNDTIFYTILVTNNRNVSISTLVIDTLDSRLNYNLDCSNSCSSSNSDNSTELTWNSIFVGANSTVTLTFSVDIDLVAAPGQLWNTAITGYYNGVWNSASSSVSVDIQDTGQGGPAVSSINITKTSDFSQRKAGENLQYTVTATYTGTGETLYFSDTLDPRLVYNSSSCDNFSQSGQSLTWNTYFNNNTTYSCTIDVTVDANAALGTLTNTVIASDNNTAQAPEPKSATNTIQIVGTNAALLSISKTASQTSAIVGASYSYTLNYANIGAQNLTGVVVADTLDSRLTFTGGPGCSAVLQLVTCNVGNLTTNSTGSFTISVTVNTGAAAGILGNTGIISSNESPAASSVTYVRIDTPLTTPSLTISKTASVSTIEPSQAFTYTLSYTNTGNVALTGVNIVDVLDSRLNFSSCSGGCSFSSPTVTWNLGSVAAGATANLSLNVIVDPAAATGILANTGILSSNETAPVSNSVNVTIVPPTTPSDINITKTASQINVPRNTGFTYTLGYANPNATNLTGVVITDTLDSRLILNSVPGGCTFVSPLLTCNLGTLTPGQSGNIVLNVSTTISAAYGILSNTVFVASNETGTKSVVEFISVIPVVTASSLTLTKSASQNNVNPGSSFSYTLTYTNSSGVAVTGATLVDDLDPRLNFVSCSGGCVQAGQNVSWNLGNLAIGASGSFIVNVSVIGSATTGLLLNNAIFDSLETAPTNAVAPVAVIDITVVPTPSLTIAKTSSSQTLQRGDNYTYTLTYTNGPTAITNAIVTDTLDSRLGFVSCTGGCIQSGQNITWNIGNLAANATGNFIVTVSVASNATVGALNNTATIDSTETTPSNGTVVVAVVVDPGTPKLTVTKTASNDTRAPGENITYTIAYQNTANLPVTGATLVDVLDPRLNFVSCTGGCVQAGQNVSWNLGNLAASASGSLTIVVTVSNSATTGLVNNTATFDSNETAPASSLAAVAIIENATASVSLTKIASSTSLLRGDSYSYTITYLNGNLTTTNAVITDTLDSRLSFVSCTGGCIQSGQNLTWNIGTLNPSQTASVTVTVQVAASASVGSLDNTATIDTTETSPVNSTERVAIIVNPETPYLKIDGSASPSKAKRGDIVVFTVNYSNPTTQNITASVLNVPLDPSFTFANLNPQLSLSSKEVAFQSCTASCTFLLNNISWNLGTLTPGQTGSVTFTVIVNNSAPTGLVEAGLNLNSNQTTTQTGRAGLAIVEDIPANINLASSSSISTVQRGDNYSYTLTYTNNGLAVTNATLASVFDSKVDFLNCTGGCSQSGNTLNWNLGNLAANQSGFVTYNVRVRNDAAQGAVTNVSTVDSAETSPANASTTVAMIIPNLANSSPKLTISIAPSDSFVLRSDVFNYNITYTNTSGQTINNAFIKNTLDERIKLVQCLGCNQNGSTLNWGLGTLAAGDTGNLTYQVQVQDSAFIGILTNIAIFGSQEVSTAGASTDISVVTSFPLIPTIRTGGADRQNQTGSTNTQQNNFQSIALALILSGFIALSSIYISKASKKIRS